MDIFPGQSIIELYEERRQARAVLKPEAFFQDGEVVAPVEQICVGDLVKFDPNDPDYPVDRVLSIELIEDSDILPRFIRVTHARGIWSKAVGELVAVVGRDIKAGYGD